MMGDVEERIRKRAYEIWEQEGSPHGREAEHWRQAADEVAAQQTTGFAVGDEAGPAPSGGTIADAAVAESPAAGATKPATRRRTAGGQKEPTAKSAASEEPATKPKATRSRKKAE